MIAYIVTGVVLLAISTALITGMWKASKYLVIPMQVLIFLVLIFIVVKVFFTSNNIKTLNNEIEKSGIVDSQKRAAQGIFKAAQTNSNQLTKQVADSQQEKIKESPEGKKTESDQKKVSAPTTSPQGNQSIDPIDLL